MDTILTIAFVIAVVSFLKTQFGWADKHALIVAFFVTILVGLAPQVAVVFPEAKAWIEAVQNAIVIFLGAAGSYDFAVDLMRKKEEVVAELFDES
jgi:hypothetical protein